MQFFLQRCVPRLATIWPLFGHCFYVSTRKHGLWEPRNEFRKSLSPMTAGGGSLGLRLSGHTYSSFEVLRSQSSSGNMTPVKSFFSSRKSNSWEKRAGLDLEREMATRSFTELCVCQWCRQWLLWEKGGISLVGMHFELNHSLSSWCCCSCLCHRETSRLTHHNPRFTLIHHNNLTPGFGPAAKIAVEYAH